MNISEPLLLPATPENLPGLVTSLKAALMAHRPCCADCTDAISSESDLRHRLADDGKNVQVCRTCFNEELAVEILETRAKS